jgi:phospholipid transport system substrate-binding protein
MCASDDIERELTMDASFTLSGRDLGKPFQDLLRSWCRLGAVIVCSAGLHPSLAMAAAMAPDALVMQTVREVQHIVKGDAALQAGDQRRTYELVEKKILPHFDFSRMTMLAVGKDWSRATPAQQEAMTAGFRALLVKTYAGALALYKDSQVQVQPVVKENGDTVAVRSRVSAPGSPPVAMDYRMHRVADSWKVHDVTVEGVSLVTTYRTSFKTEIDRHGFDGLIKLLANRSASDESSTRLDSAR